MEGCPSGLKCKYMLIVDDRMTGAIIRAGAVIWQVCILNFARHR